MESILDSTNKVMGNVEMKQQKWLNSGRGFNTYFIDKQTRKYDQVINKQSKEEKLCNIRKYYNGIRMVTKKKQTDGVKVQVQFFHLWMPNINLKLNALKNA